MEVKTSGIALIEHAIALADKRGMEAPEGLTWTLKAVRPDLRSYNDFRWPFPGGWAETSNIDHENRGPCPSFNGDGLCAAKTWSAMLYGGQVNTLLLVGYENERVLGADKEKLRAPRMYVRDIIDGERLVREYGTGANLRGANLRRADLEGADLEGADLEEAYLRGAHMRRVRHNETTVWPSGFDVMKEVSDEGIKEAREARGT